MKYKLLLAFLMLWSSTGPVFAAVDREQSRRYYEQALEFLRSDSFSETVIELRNSLQQDPNNLPARIMLGTVLLRQDQPRAAIKELEKAQAMGGDENLILIPLATAYLEVAEPEHVITGFAPRGHKPEIDGELMLLQAEAALQISDRTRAEELFLNAGTLLPVDPRPILGRARLALSKGKVDRATTLVDEAVVLAPDSFEAWMFKAIFMRDTHQYQAAQDAFARALEINPTSGRALTARAALWLDMGNSDKAKADLAQVRDLQSDTLETIYLRTLMMFREGKGDEAREALRESAEEIKQIKEEFRSKLPNTELMLGVVAFFEQHYDEALVHLKKFLGAFPNHSGAQRYLASTYLALGDYKQVIRIYKPSARAQPPRDPMALSILAEAYRAIGDSDTAEEYFGAALKLAPSVAGIGVRLAASRLESGRGEEAARELKSLVERFPELREAWVELARVYQKLGNLEEAQAVAKTLLTKFPEEAMVHNLAGSIFLAVGDQQDAELELKLAEQMDRELILPKLNLARLAVLRGELASGEAKYRSILEQFPQSTTANIELARLLNRTGEEQEALERVTDILRIDPGFFDAHELRLQLVVARREDTERIRAVVYDLEKAFPDDPRADIVAGKIYRRIRDRESARIHFRRAVEKAQFETETLYAAGTQQYAIGDLSGALWTLTKAEQASPNNLNVGILKAAVLVELKEFDKAAEKIAELAKKHGEKAEVHTVRGDLLMAQREPGKASESYLKAYELVPVFRTAKTYFRSLVSGGNIDTAAKFIETWMGDHPNHLPSKHLYAQLLVMEQDWPKAIEMYEQLQREGLEDVQLLNNLATAYQHAGDARALPTAEAAFKQAPKDPSVADTYGWILTENGRQEEGLAILREAFARASTSPEIRYHIGLALARMGRNKEASEEVEAALAANRSFTARDEATTLLDRLRNALK